MIQTKSFNKIKCIPAEEMRRRLKKGEKKSCLPNKVFHAGEETMSLRAKGVNVSTLCQLGTRSGEADMEDKRY